MVQPFLVEMRGGNFGSRPFVYPLQSNGSNIVPDPQQRLVQCLAYLPEKIRSYEKHVRYK